MTNNGNIYLSGGMQFAPNLGAEWRSLVSERLRSLSFTPLNITELDVAYTVKHGDMATPPNGPGEITAQLALAYRSNIRHHFINADLQLIQKHADAVLLYYSESARRGAGTISEAQISFTYNVPVFVVSEWGAENHFQEVPGWLQGLSTRLFGSFETALHYFADLPPGILIPDQYNNRRSKNKYLCHLCGDVFRKNKQHFVSHVQPVYCKPCVNLVADTHECKEDRLTFMERELGFPSRRI